MRLNVLSLVVLLGCGRTDPHGTEIETSMLCLSEKGTPQTTHFAAWPLGACLDVTYGEAAEAHAKGLHAALLEWASVPGTWLCFNPPMPGAVGAQRAVHVEVGFPNPPSTVSLVEVKHDLKGVLLEANVTFVPDRDFTHGAYLHAAGQVLGFVRTDGVDTVLNSTTLDDVKAMLTEADRQSVAAVYPACR